MPKSTTKFRPKGEPLETRLAPAVYDWTPTVVSNNEADWSNLQNWRVGAQVPGALPGPNDEVRLYDFVDIDVDVEVNPIGKLKLLDDQFQPFTGRLLLNNNIVVNGDFELSSGAIHTGLNSDAYLQFKGDGTWKKTNFVADGGADEDDPSIVY